jgi:hypothetical protein
MMSEHKNNPVSLQELKVSMLAMGHAVTKQLIEQASSLRLNLGRSCWKSVRRISEIPNPTVQ